MIKLLQKMRSRRGFTIAELIIVIMVIAILAVMILPTLDSKKATIEGYISASQDMYIAMQSVFTKYSLTEAPLSLGLKAESTPTDGSYIHFFKKVGGNYPCKAGGTSFPDMPETCDLFIEVTAKGGVIGDVYVGNSFKDLLARGDNVKDTALGELLKNDIDAKVDLHDGYYYVKVSYEAVAPVLPATTTDEINTVKVNFAAFSEKQFPTYSGDWGDYVNQNLQFSYNKSYTTARLIVGVFGPLTTNGAGETHPLGGRGTVLG